MTKDLLLLIGLQIQISWNEFRRKKLWHKLLFIVGGGLFAALIIFSSAVLGLGLGALLRRFPQAQLEGLLPGLVLTAITLLLVVVSFGVALGSLFFSRDLVLLMSAPISRRAVFTSKILGGFSAYYLLMLGLAAPALISYGIGLGYGALYYVLMLPALLGGPLLPAGLGALLVLLVTRIVPARRVREALAVVGALFGTSCGLLGNLSSQWTRQFNSANADFENLLAGAQRLAGLPVPSLMAGRGLAAAGQGQLWPALGLMSAYLLLTFGLFGVCIWAADRLYASGWLRMQSGGTAKRSPRARRKAGAAQGGLLQNAPPFLAIALKDWRIIPRDLRHLAQYLSSLIFIPIIYIQFFALGGDNSGMESGMAQLAPGVDFTNVMMAGGVLASMILIFNNMALSGISMEGRAYWMLKIAPISARELLFSKFFAAMLPFALLSSVLLGVAALVRHFSIGGFLYGWMGIQLLGAGMLAMSVGLSVPWANLDWDDPRKMRSGWGGLIAFIGIAVVGLAGGVSLALPYLAGRWLPFLAPVAWLVGPFLATGISGLAAVLGLWLGLSRLHALGEA